jgi:hypothetical protein
VYIQPVKKQDQFATLPFEGKGADRSGLWSIVIALPDSTTLWLSGSSFLEKEAWSEVESVSFLPMSFVVQSLTLLAAPPVIPGMTRGIVVYVYGYGI